MAAVTSSTIHVASVASSTCTVSQASRRQPHAEQVAADLAEAVEVVHVAGEERHVGQRRPSSSASGASSRGRRGGQGAQLGEVGPQRGQVGVAAGGGGRRGGDGILGASRRRTPGARG